jgi:hypothetical protein
MFLLSTLEAIQIHLFDEIHGHKICVCNSCVIILVQREEFEPSCLSARQINAYESTIGDRTLTRFLHLCCNFLSNLVIHLLFLTLLINELLSE